MAFVASGTHYVIQICLILFVKNLPFTLVSTKWVAIKAPVAIWTHGYRNRYGPRAWEVTLGTIISCKPLVVVMPFGSEGELMVVRN
jgi:hypothetical protein